MSFTNIPVLILAFLLVGLATSKFPPSFKKCARKDKDFNECLRVAIEDAVHLLAKGQPIGGLPSLNPLHVPELVIDAGQAAVKVVQKYKNWNTYGFGDVQITTTQADFDKNELSLEFMFPKAEMKADYEAEGSVLVLPVKGHGASQVIMHKLKGNLKMPFDFTEKDGKKFLQFNGCVLELNPELVQMDYENLFEGNPDLSKTINKALNDNWQDVFADVKTSFEAAYCANIKQLGNRFFTKVSVDEAFD